MPKEVTSYACIFCEKLFIGPMQAKYCEADHIKVKDEKTLFIINSNNLNGTYRKYDPTRSGTVDHDEVVLSGKQFKYLRAITEAVDLLSVDRPAYMTPGDWEELLKILGYDV